MGFESRETPTYRVPAGFIAVSKLGTKEPSTVGEYKSQGLTGAEPGKYAQNNGTLAAVTSEGKICVWIPKPDASTPREVPYEQAIKNLKDGGYTQGNFYVPQSNA